MLSSMCPVMAANLSVSYFRFGHLASVPVAGSIGTWIVARLFRMAAGPAYQDNTRAVAGSGSSRKEPPVAGACTVGGVLD